MCRGLCGPRGSWDISQPSAWLIILLAWIMPLKYMYMYIGKEYWFIGHSFSIFGCYVALRYNSIHCDFLTVRKVPVRSDYISMTFTPGWAIFHVISKNPKKDGEDIFFLKIILVFPCIFCLNSRLGLGSRNVACVKGSRDGIFRCRRQFTRNGRVVQFLLNFPALSLGVFSSPPARWPNASWKIRF